MVGTLVAARIEPEMNACGEHAGMLAGAIVVDRKRPGATPHEIAKGLLADRPMGAAGKVALIEARASEQASYRLDMHAVAAMRSARDRKLGLAKPERIGGAALDQQNGLERFHRGAREDGTLDVANRECELTGRIGDPNVCLSRSDRQVVRDGGDHDARAGGAGRAAASGATRAR